MKFLWESNAPWAGTGYGSQTRLLLHELQKIGHEPSCFCFYGLAGGTLMYDGYKCWPNSDYDTFGNDVIQLHADRADAEVIVTLMDLFVLNKDIWSKLRQPWIAWVPIDGVGLGYPNLELLEVVDYPVAMSNFGMLQMQEADIEVTAGIYHAVDTEVMIPGDKAESRALLGLPDDAFVIGMVMANKGDRKQYPAQLEAVKLFADKNPDLNVLVYMHTDPTHNMGGWDMKGLVKASGLKGKVYSTNQYDTVVVPSPPEFLAKVYNAMDVLMNCSAGEGFGIPIVEAQSCGIPVVVGNYTAMAELVANGYGVEADSKWRASHYGYQFHPSVDDMVYRLECVYRMLGKKESLAGREWVVANCSVPVIAQQWHTLLEHVKEQGKPPRVAPRTVAALPEGYDDSTSE